MRKQADSTPEEDACQRAEKQALRTITKLPIADFRLASSNTPIEIGNRQSKISNFGTVLAAFLFGLG